MGEDRMDERVKELIEWTQMKFGLNHYFLQTYDFNRNVNIFNETNYSLSMEWFPHHERLQEDGSNPKGTAIIELDMKSRQFHRVIFVRGKSYAENGISFANLNMDDIIQWVENETGLRYGEQFQLHKEENGEVYFKECIDGVDVSPSGSIEINFDQDGKLTLFAVHGQFPSQEMIQEEAYTLSFEKIEGIAREQLKLVEYPSFEQEKLFPVYGVEEIFIRNNRSPTIPFEFIVDVKSFLQINQIVSWDNPLKQDFHRKEIDWLEDVSVEQAFSFEPSPDSLPISEAEQEKCMTAVKTHLRQVYPEESGQWLLKSLHRDKGYICATLRIAKGENRLFKRKLTIFIDKNSFQAVNYIDNNLMLDAFNEFQAPEEIRVSQEAAFEKIRDLYELKAYYVYDFEEKQYILCGKLDCQYGVDASSGEMIKVG